MKEGSRRSKKAVLRASRRLATKTACQTWETAYNSFGHHRQALMRPRLYLETTIPSYLVARASRDAILNGQQAATRKWWEQRRGGYNLFVSEFVDLEAGRGEAAMSSARAAALRGLPRLAATEDARELAAEILGAGLIPAKAAVDASHIAVAAVHRMDILLTWNCTHIHNIAISRHIERLCARAGWPCPAICTPFDLLAS